MPVECLVVSPVHIVDKRLYIAMLFRRLVLVNFGLSIQCSNNASTTGFLHTLIRNILYGLHILTVIISTNYFITIKSWSPKSNTPVFNPQLFCYYCSTQNYWSVGLYPTWSLSINYIIHNSMTKHVCFTESIILRNVK